MLHWYQVITVLIINNNIFKIQYPCYNSDRFSFYFSHVKTACWDDREKTMHVLNHALNSLLFIVLCQLKPLEVFAETSVAIIIERVDLQ